MAGIRFELGASVLQFSRNIKPPVQRPLEKVQVIDRTAGGTLQVEELGINIRTRPIVFKALPKAEYDQLENWFDVIANGAQNAFTYYDERGNSMEVKIVSPVLNFTEFHKGWFAGELLLEVVG